MNLLLPLALVVLLQSSVVLGANAPCHCDLGKLYLEVKKQYGHIFKALRMSSGSYRNLLKTENSYKRKMLQTQPCPDYDVRYQEAFAACGELTEHLRETNKRRGLGGMFALKSLITLIGRLLGEDDEFVFGQRPEHSSASARFASVLAYRLRELLKFALVSVEYQINPGDLGDMIDGLVEVIGTGGMPTSCPHVI